MARPPGSKGVETPPARPEMMGPGPGTIVLAPGKWRQMFLSLSSRDFRIYWIGMLFAFVGMQVGQVARQWLVYELTGSSTYLGIIGAATGMAMLFFRLVGAVLPHP